MEQRPRTAGFGAVAIKALLLLIGIVGQLAGTVFDHTDFMSGGHFLYYTHQSNLAVMAVIAVFLVYDILRLVRGARAPMPPNWLMIVRFSVTVAIALTFLVFSMLLTPQMIAESHADYLFSINNLCVHNLVPLLAVLDWCLFGYPIRARRWTFLWGAIMPLYYCVFALVLSTTGADAFGSGRKVPYFFFDYDKIGWLRIQNGQPGFVWWFLILCVVVLAMGFGLMAVAQAAGRARAARDLA